MPAVIARAARDADYAKALGRTTYYLGRIGVVLLSGREAVRMTRWRVRLFRRLPAQRA